MGAIYVECSSKEMSGVHEVFELAVDTAVGQEIQIKQQTQSRQQYGGNVATVNGGRMKKSKKRNCPIL